MRFRDRLVAALFMSTACTGSPADAGPSPAPPPRPAPTAPQVVPVAAPARITQVATMFVASQPRPAGEAAAPWSLTASDGSGLVLTRVDAKAVVEGPLAFTELHLHFHNPEARVREGTFAITLPEGAAVSRFAMESAGQLLEAEVVEKQRARRVYEDFLHRKQDPALLEKGEGNQFSARVFPIAPGADKHLVISYSQEVAPGHYALPLRGLPRVERVDVRVQVRGQDRGQTGDIAEDRDVVVDATTVGAPAAIAAGNLAAARLRVELSDAAAPPASVTILVDTSASRALGFAAQAHAVHALVDELARDYGAALPVQVVAFDQVTAPIYDGRADRIGNIEAALAARGALGASDLGQALAWLAGHAPKSRVVVVTDGVVTAGAAVAELRALAKQLAGNGVERIDVALTGGIRDGEAAAAVARAGLRRTGAILDLDRGVADVARRIGLTVRTEVPITADGARWVFPRSIEAAQSGDEVTVFVRRDPQGQQLALGVGGVRTTVSPVAVTPALLGRAFASAEIAELDHQLATATGAAADQLRADIVVRSLAARVVSSQTSMLVLESDADYARYGIDRTALADILAIGPSGVELLHRAPPAQAQIAVPVTAQNTPPRKGDAERTARYKSKGEAEDQAKTQAEASKDANKLAAADAKAESRLDGRVGPQAREEAKQAGDVEDIEVTAGLATSSLRGGAAGASAAPAATPPPPAPPPPPAVAAPAPMRQPEPRAEITGERSASVRASAGSASGPVDHRRGVAESDGDGPARPRQALAVRRSAPAQDPYAESDRAGRDSERSDDDDGLAVNRRKPALRGELAAVEQELAAGHAHVAYVRAAAWHDREPGNVLALIGLGDVLEARRDLDTAARVYGSIIDLYPARADFRRFAGERLERIGKAQRALVIDTYRRAALQRPDHLTGHRLLAYALVRDGQYAAAFAAILDGIDRQYPAGRFAGAERVLAEDVGMIGAAYAAHVPGKRDEVMAQLARHRIALPTHPSTRFIMYWETDGNDVDFHIRDAHGGHAWYSNRRLASGGELYADITTGYGPECFAIPGTPKAGPYRLSINYYSQGPMGYGMGLLQVQTYDGQGNLGFEDRPYVIMTDQAFVDLGTYR
jgi:tetratricopeptide (TPR) repeat protein